ncbi:MAG: ABC transporter ATP-binding protein [Clostridia bacterium]|nr:ABC transporter ATP-binding protein [Clostridia bacterium]
MSAMLEIRDLKVDLMTQRGIVYALQGVNLALAKGELPGLAGGSGCGQALTAKAIMRLLPRDRSRFSGSIRFEGTELLDAKEKYINKLRGDRISMIFQDPMVSLNPLMTIGDQIGEIYRIHNHVSKAEARKRAAEMLELVGIPPADKRMKQYPFELSGGLQQRVMIAIACACKPELLIADEPTTALDVTIQAQILDLLKTLRKELNMSILLITHNFGIVAEVCDRVSVMYAGRVIETADTRDIFRNAKHPYSRALIASIPRAGGESEYLPTIPGAPPRLFERINGCAYAPRCPYACDVCRSSVPETNAVSENHTAACPVMMNDMAGNI